MRASYYLGFLLLVLFCHGQSRKNDRVYASFDNTTLEVIFDSLTSQTDYFFSYNSNLLPKGSRYTISADGLPIDQFLSRLLVGTNLDYSFYKDQIIINYQDPEEVPARKGKYFSISGTVYDENGEPLRDVNVFLDGTTLGVSSDIDGNFKLESIPPGFYNIVFSFIGYNNASYQISENNGGSRIQDHKMELDLEQLKEVEVIANRIPRSENSWQAHFTVFKKELIGQTESAIDCVIENPEALDFSYDKANNILRAFAEEPIQIRNDAMGYRISYYLESFKKETNDLRFRGKMIFRNLEPLSGKERRDWRRNRKIGYHGSLNHFKKALLAGDLSKEGFRIYHLGTLDNFEIDPENELSENDIIVFKGNHYELDFRSYLIVEYRREKESLDFLRGSEFRSLIYAKKIDKNGILVKNPDNQISIVRLLRGAVKLDLSGEVMDRFGLATYGYWSWERLADLVPINYDPKLDNL